MISFDDAFGLVAARAKPLGVETVPIARLSGRRLSEDCRARCDLPVFDNSAVDGFAVHEADVGGGRLPIAFEVRAGSAPREALRAGFCARIFTGAPLPVGGVGVCMQEDVAVADGWATIPALDMGAHVRRRGEELKAGDIVARKGSLVNPAVVSALASAGVASAGVHRRPVVGILVTGDELVEPGQELTHGRIYESNSVALQAAIGREVLTMRCIDEPWEIQKALVSLTEACDVVLTTGGVSVGEYDLVRPALKAIGIEEIFWRVSMKPAKPTFFGAGKFELVFGLPGNPVSALTAYALLVAPCLAAMEGGACALQTETGHLGAPVRKSGDREEFLPVRAEPRGFAPILGRASHKPRTFAEATHLARLPIGLTEVEPEMTLTFVKLPWVK